MLHFDTLSAGDELSTASKPVLAAVLDFDTLQKPQLSFGELRTALNQRTAFGENCPVSGSVISYK